jgi:hypothetical protein
MKVGECSLRQVEASVDGWKQLEADEGRRTPVEQMEPGGSRWRQMKAGGC